MPAEQIIAEAIPGHVDRARAVSAMAQSVTDALQAAATIAIRGSDLFNGSDDAIVFHDAAIAIGDFRKHPAIQAMLLAAHRTTGK